MAVRKIYGENKFKVWCPNCKEVIRKFDFRTTAQSANEELMKKHQCENKTDKKNPLLKKIREFWEVVDDTMENFNTYRSKVPGGWLVALDGVLTHDVGVDEEVCEEATHQLAMQFISDPTHSWKLNRRG